MMSLKVIVLLLLSFVTIILFNFYERYIEIGAEILQNPRFQQGLDRWRHSQTGILLKADESGIVALQSQDLSTRTYITQIIPEPKRFHPLRFSADLKTEGVINGDASWKTARLVLSLHNAQGKGLYYLPHILVGKAGNNEWGHHEKVFLMDDNAAEIRLSAELMHATGSMQVKNISLKPVSEKVEFSHYRMIIIGLWLAALAWVSIPLARNMAHSSSGIAAMLIILAIATGAFLPGSLKKHVDQVLPAIIFPMEHAYMPPSRSLNNSITKQDPSFQAINIYKLGHYLLFTMLSVVIFMGRYHGLSMLKRVAYILLLALITEILQLFIQGRDARLSDLLLDAGGILTGAGIFKLMLRFKVRKTTIS